MQPPSGIMMTERLRRFLDAHDVRHHVHSHEERITAQETAQVTHIPGGRFAKGVLLRRNGGGTERYVLAVLPARERVDLARLGGFVGAPVELAEEDELARVFPGFELGAAPPIPALAAEPILAYVDAHLARGEGIAFHAGTHTDVVEMPWSEYERIAFPLVVEYGLPHVESPPAGAW
jgi:Ala-tRNA(Pro) deacylase